MVSMKFIILVFEGAPAFVLLLGGLFLPETPNSQIERGRLDEGRAVLRKVRGVENVDNEFNEILVLP